MESAELANVAPPNRVDALGFGVGGVIESIPLSALKSPTQKPPARIQVPKYVGF